MDSHWDTFDAVNDAHELFLKTVAKIERQKAQRTVGKKPAQYVVECVICKQIIEFAFTGIDSKKKGFVCFDCLAKD